MPDLRDLLRLPRGGSVEVAAVRVRADNGYSKKLVVENGELKVKAHSIKKHGMDDDEAEAWRREGNEMINEELEERGIIQ